MCISKSSRKCRCKSVMFSFVNFSSSSTEPMHIWSDESSTLIHTGIQLPQYRFLLIAQSLAFPSQFENRLSPINPGTQCVDLLSSTILSLIFSTLTNHVGMAL